MFASLLTIGVMIELILLSVWLFPGEVEAGPLQISMTLATLLAVGVAYHYGFHGAFVACALGIGMAFAPYAFLSYISPLVMIVLAFVYRQKETLFDDQDAQAVYGVEPEDADLPAHQLSA